MEAFQTDEQLLVATPNDPAAFGVFYERYEALVLGYLLRRTRNPEVAADLMSETFAQALRSAARFKPGQAPAVAWLLGIAQKVLATSRRRGRIEDRARRKLGMQPTVLHDADLERVAALADDASRLVANLPAQQRDAVLARIVDERDYLEIAEELGCSESVVRKRVSRGLSRLRDQMEARS